MRQPFGSIQVQFAASQYNDQTGNNAKNKCKREQTAAGFLCSRSRDRYCLCRLRDLRSRICMLDRHRAGIGRNLPFDAICFAFRFPPGRNSGGGFAFLPDLPCDFICFAFRSSPCRDCSSGFAFTADFPREIIRFAVRSSSGRGSGGSAFSRDL